MKLKRLKDIFGKDNFYVEIQLIDAENNDTSRVVAEQLSDVAQQSFRFLSWRRQMHIIQRRTTQKISECFCAQRSKRLSVRSKET